MSAEKITIIKPDFGSILKIVGIGLGLWVLYLIREIILIVLAASLLSTIISPAVNYLEKKKLPRWLGAFFVFLGILAVVALIFSAIVPMAISQSRVFVQQIPSIVTSFFNNLSLEIQTELSALLKQWFETSPLDGRVVFSLLGNVAGQIFSFFTILIIAFYLTVRDRQKNKTFVSFLPQKYQKFFESFIDSTKKQIGDWGRGLLFLSLFVGILAYLGLSILGVKFALTLALIAALTEVIPYIGPWLGAIPAVMIAFLQSPTLALLVIILYIVIQQVENVLLTPNIMHRAVGLDPLVIIIILLIGGKLAGPLGMILAVPLATICSILIKEYQKYQETVPKTVFKD
ncbi:AI-2E family transporter [Patescibacteria group bacterium]|nr:AI-2E family transporter [Patescibacteria group bacterium]